MQRWMVAAKRADFNAIAQKYSISPVTARLMRNRDIVGDEEIHTYLYGSISDMHDPSLMKDMDKAVSIILKCIKEKCRIRVIGDYDVDGICSSYILLSGIRSCKGDADCILPDRIRDGYGLNRQLIDDAYADGIRTIITCDNGIAAYDEIEYAVSMGMTVVVTDHHEVPREKNPESIQKDEMSQKIPLAQAVVDPKRDDDDYPFKGICGAAVAFKFIQKLRLEGRRSILSGSETEVDADTTLIGELIEICALATVCDVMELRDENRIIVKEGLARMQKSANRGLRTLIRMSELDGKKLTCYHLGFIIGPCLNATGRLDSAMRGLQLLESKSDAECVKIAGELKELNNLRKQMTAEGVTRACEIVDTLDEMPKVLVVFLPDAHESIAGIIAGRIREKYCRPVIVLTNAESGVKGSGRSVEGYDMFAELSGCRDLFTKFGGHSMAAGLSMSKENIEPLRQRLNAACTMKDEDFIQTQHLDMIMPLRYADKKLIDEFSILEPFGNGNSKPLFAVRDVLILSGRILGKNGNCAKFSISDENGYIYDMIYFGDIQKFNKFVSDNFGAEAADRIYSNNSNHDNNEGRICGNNSNHDNNEGRICEKNQCKINIVYYPEMNTFRDKTTLQVVMTDYMV